MNELTIKLAEQASDETSKEVAWVYNQNKWQVLFTQKFTELIVQECMDCATWVGKTNTSPVEPIHTAHAINQRMRQHFGVE